MALSATDEYFVVIQKQQQGPLTLKQLTVLFARGRANGGIGKETHVWCEEMEGWQRLREVGPLLELLEAQQQSAVPVADFPPADSPPARPPPPPTQQAQLRMPNAPHGQAAAMPALVFTDPPPPSLGPRSARDDLPAGFDDPAPTPAAQTGGAAQPVGQATSLRSPNVAAAGQSAGGSKAASKGARKQTLDGGPKHGVVRNFLLGWLPQRAPPRELVKRGILKNEAVGSNPAAAAAPTPRDIFGGEYSLVLQRADTGADGIPRVVSTLMARLRQNDYEGLRTEGIFRVSGDQGEVLAMRRRINEGADPVALVAQCQNVHSVAGLLKMFYREMQPPLFTFELYDQFIACSGHLGSPSPDEPLDCSELSPLLARLPASHYTLLRHLVEFLCEVPRFSETSKMGVGNTAAVFAPNLIRPEVQTLEHLADAAHTVNLLVMLIHRFREIFGGGDDGDGAAADADAGDGEGSRGRSASINRASMASTMSLALSEDDGDNDEHHANCSVPSVSRPRVVSQGGSSGSVVGSDGGSIPGLGMAMYGSAPSLISASTSSALPSGEQQQPQQQPQEQPPIPLEPLTDAEQISAQIAQLREQIAQQMRQLKMQAATSSEASQQEEMKLVHAQMQALRELQQRQVEMEVAEQLRAAC